MFSKNRKYDLRIIVPTVLSVVFGALVLFGVVGYVLFRNTALLDYGVVQVTHRKICQDENLDKVKQIILREDPATPDETENDRLRRYYLFEYSVCEGGNDESELSIFIDDFNGFLSRKGIAIEDLEE